MQPIGKTTTGRAGCLYTLGCQVDSHHGPEDPLLDQCALGAAVATTQAQGVRAREARVVPQQVRKGRDGAIPKVNPLQQRQDDRV
jgi:hypothetical protein